MSLLSKKSYILVLAVAVPLLGLAAWSFFSSKDSEEKGKVKTSIFDSLPTMNSDSVTMLMSDSGLIRYKLITETWLIFERAKEPHWLFPDKIYMEQLDTTFNVVATVKADSAWNYTKKKLWKLRGNVEIKNTLGEVFTSIELFLDERSQKVYSVEYVNIKRPGKMDLGAEGGFVANQQMTEYEFTDVRDTDLFVEEKDGTKEEK